MNMNIDSSEAADFGPVMSRSIQVPSRTRSYSPGLSHSSENFTQNKELSSQDFIQPGFSHLAHHPLATLLDYSPKPSHTLFDLLMRLLISYYKFSRVLLSVQPTDMTLAHLQDTQEYLRSREETEGRLRHSTDTYFIDRKTKDQSLTPSPR